MAQYRLTGIYDQPLVDPFEWIAQGRPVGAYPTRTYRPGDTIDFRDDEERDRLLSLGVVEEAPEQQSAEDQQRQIEERREAAQQEQRDASDGLSGGDSREDLQREAEALGLPKSGSKAELRERIDAHRQSQE